MTPVIADAGPWLMLALLGAYHGINPGMGWLFAVALGLQERNRKAVIRAFAPIALGHAASIAAVVVLVALLQGMVSPTLLRWVGASLLLGYGLYKLLAPMSHPRWVGMRVGFRDLAVWSFLMATAHGAGLMLVPILIKIPSGEPPPASTAVVMAAPSPSPTALASPLTPLADHHHDHTMPPMAEEDAPDTHAGHEGHAGHLGHSSDSGGPVTAEEHEDHTDHSQHLRQAGITSPAAAIGAVALHTGAMLLTMAVIALVVYEKVGLAILRRAWFNLDLVWAIALIGAGVLTFFV
jgi:hypothetical protein